MRIWKRCYERRPSAWIEPIGDCGEGAVTLIEIPTKEKFMTTLLEWFRKSAQDDKWNFCLTASITNRRDLSGPAPT